MATEFQDRMTFDGGVEQALRYTESKPKPSGSSKKPYPRRKPRNDTYSDEAFAAADAAEADIVARRKPRVTDMPSEKLDSDILSRIIGRSIATTGGKAALEALAKNATYKAAGALAGKAASAGISKGVSEMAEDESESLPSIIGRSIATTGGKAALEALAKNTAYKAGGALAGKAASAGISKGVSEMIDEPAPVAKPVSVAEPIPVARPMAESDPEARLTDFRVATGTRFNPESSADKKYMQVLEIFRASNPDLPPSKLAAEVYKTQGNKRPEIFAEQFLTENTQQGSMSREADSNAAPIDAAREFKTITGTSFNPKSSADKRYMEKIQRVRQSNPNLSTKQLARLIYQSE